MLNPLRLDPDAPWRQRFNISFLFNTTLAARNAQRGVAITNRDVPAPQLHAWDVDSGNLRQLTEEPNGVFSGWIDPHGHFAYFHRDLDGSEMGHLWRIPFAGGPAEDVTPQAEPFTLRGIQFSHQGNRLAWNPVNKAGFQLWVCDVDPAGQLGPARQVFVSEPEAWGAMLSANGEWAAMISTARTGTRMYSLLVFDLNSNANAPMAELWDGPEASTEGLLFSTIPGDPRIAGTSSRTGFRRPFIWNPLTNERLDLALDALHGDIAPLDWSPDGQWLLLSQFERATQRLHLYDLHTHTHRALEHPGGTYGVTVIGAAYTGDRGAFFGPNGELFAQRDGADFPVHLIELDRTTGQQKRVVLAASTPPPSRPWRSVSFPSSDGVEVQAWVALPDDTAKGPFPLILEVHGGPHDVVTETFNPLCQIWLDHGFAYCNVNYRGSLTFGQEFQAKIWGDIGHWEVEDVLAARRWLIDQGIADPNRIIMTGGSYGGFLTLLTLSKHPECNWAGGLAMAPLADIVTAYEDASDALRGAFKAWFRATPDENPEAYRVASPLTYAEQLRAPLLIIHGRNDSRTPARQVELYEARLKALGKTVEVWWYDAGHGGMDMATILRVLEMFLTRAYQMLGVG